MLHFVGNTRSADRLNLVEHVFIDSSQHASDIEHGRNVCAFVRFCVVLATKVSDGALAP